MQDDKEFFRQARRFSAEILSDFKGNQRGMEEKDLSDSVLTVFRSTQRCVQKGNRPCAQRHTRTDSKSYLPPSAGFTACATCCLWNASDSILKYSTKVNTQISFFSQFSDENGPDAKDAPGNQIIFAVFIFTPGPMVEAATQERIYWPLAVAGLALTIAPMRAL